MPTTDKNKGGSAIDMWDRVQQEWDNTPPAEKAAFYERNAGIIDRWQAETDALAGTDDEDTEKEP